MAVDENFEGYFFPEIFSNATLIVRDIQGLCLVQIPFSTLIGRRETSLGVCLGTCGEEPSEPDR
jgi:hypothetical protein